MILPGFILPEYINQRWNESGIDSLNHCLNQSYFLNFPWPVDYQYNSRGYRDQEWPTDINELTSAVWCIGDSFTVGIGSPLAHTWPYLLSKKLNTRTINVSMDGASNNWIARKISDLVHEVIPKTIVVHWSYAHRREEDWQHCLDRKWNHVYSLIKYPDWPECKTINDFFNLPDVVQQHARNNFQIDNLIKNSLDSNHSVYKFDIERKIWHDQFLSDDQNFENTIQCINAVEEISNKHNIKLIHSFIPNFADPNISQKVQNYLSEKNISFIKAFPNLDFARDYHHYDVATSKFFVEEICKKFNC
jgi:hypothetical protein